MQLFDTDPFEKEAYDADFKDIVNGAIDPDDGYHHCVVVYQTNGKEVENIQLVVLDPRFNVVARESLAEYMKPDFARLTDFEPAERDMHEVHNEATRRLASLKPNVQPVLREKEKDA